MDPYLCDVLKNPGLSYSGHLLGIMLDPSSTTHYRQDASDGKPVEEEKCIISLHRYFEPLLAMPVLHLITPNIDICTVPAPTQIILYPARSCLHSFHPQSRLIRHLEDT